MPKPKKNTNRQKGWLIAAIIALLVAVIMMSLSMYKKENIPVIGKRINVSLGAMAVAVQEGKAVERQDETVKNLESFLRSMAQKDIDDGCKSTHYNVIAANEDESQVLLSYGCDYQSARMFAVNTGGEWSTISPTNQFDQFGIPKCEHVEQNNIDKSIAPVCVNRLNDSGSQPAYVTR